MADTNTRPRTKRGYAFYKMHGLGNDFMVIERLTQNVELRPEDIARWGDRHTGIGFDQLLLIDAPTIPDADFKFGIFNTDGSEAEQCGNGTRSVALLARELKLSAKTALTWQSPAGLVRTEYQSPEQITTTMTVPVLEATAIPCDPTAAETSVVSSASHDGLPAPLVLSLDADGERVEATAVSMGNPHAVVFVDDIFEAPVERLGAILTRHPAFPAGANVGFC